jgi:hypothetical protein
VTPTSRILQDNAEYQVIEETDPSQGWKSVRVQYKKGTPQANREAIRDKAQQARAYLLKQTNAWPGLSVAQKMDVVQNLLGITANLVALALDDDSDEGV